MNKQIEALKLALHVMRNQGDIGVDEWIAASQAILEALAEQSAQQEPVAYGMWDTMLGKGNRMMMVRLDKGQDGCTVPLYTAHGITKGNT